MKLPIKIEDEKYCDQYYTLYLMRSIYVKWKFVAGKLRFQKYIQISNIFMTNTSQNKRANNPNQSSPSYSIHILFTIFCLHLYTSYINKAIYSFFFFLNTK